MGCTRSDSVRILRGVEQTFAQASQMNEKRPPVSPQCQLYERLRVLKCNPNDKMSIFGETTHHFASMGAVVNPANHSKQSDTKKTECHARGFSLLSFPSTAHDPVRCFSIPRGAFDVI
jgi:hypothetical protein